MATRVARRAELGSEHASTHQHLRGSSLLLCGRMIALGVNFAVQVLIVRYLSKTDYGAFAYALSIVTMGTHVALLGFEKAVARFVPLFQEAGDRRSMLGTIVLAVGIILGLGTALIVLAFGLQGVLTRSVTSNPLSVGLLLILIGLAPLQALDSLFQDLLAVFGKPRAIFLRRYVLAPFFRLAAILLVIWWHGSVRVLAFCYLFAGMMGVGIYLVILRQVFREQGLFRHFEMRSLRFPVRRLLSFSLPLLTIDLVFVLKTTIAVLVLEYYHGSTEVAEFRAVIPLANLNLVVFQSFRMLYVPAASRLYARKDAAGINDLFWQSAMWTAVISFPVFTLCFLLAEPVTVLLFGSTYARSANILAILAVGNYFNAAMGLNMHTLQVYSRVRFVAGVNVITALVALGLNLWWIPLYGGVGAAMATTCALFVQNILNHLGLLLGTGVELFDRRYGKVYASILACTAVLVVARTLAETPVVLDVVLLFVITFVLLRVNRDILRIGHTFPRLSRIPWLRPLVGVEPIPRAK